MTFEFAMTSIDDNVSPAIDLDRVSAILTTNRINSPVSDFASDSRVNQTGEDPCAATYVSNLIVLENPATSLKVQFASYRRDSSDISSSSFNSLTVKSRLIIFAADLAASISCESFTPTAINSTLVYLLAKKATSAESIPPEKETVIFFSQSFLTAFSIACPISKSLSLLTLKYWIR